MAKIRVAENYYEIRCPGCGEWHHPGFTWQFNGDVDRPTLSPSILVRSGCAVNGDKSSCWCTYEERYGEPSPFKCGVCHSFVRDGRIEFLSDCTHALAGQTVDLPEIE